MKAYTVARGSISGRFASRWQCDPWLISAALLALIPILTITRPGMPNTADGQVHLLRTLEVSHLLHAGVLYPRWAPDFYLGYGYPFFNFYAPGAHLLASWIALTGLGILRGMIAVQVLALILYPTGAYLLARSLFSTDTMPAAKGAAPAALLSAALYLYAPLRWRELFVQGNLSQLLALGLLPWCAWLLTETARSASLRWTVAAGTALSLLVYVHHPSALLGFGSLAVYATALAIIVSRDHRSPEIGHRIIAVGLAFLLGLSLSALFWLPSLLEQRYVNLGAIQSGMFNVRHNAVPLGELLSPATVQDDGALNPPMPNSLGIAQLGLALAGLALAIKWAAGGDGGSLEQKARLEGRGRWSRRQAGITLLVVAGLLLLSLLLILPMSARLWEIVPLARSIAFPWRMLGPVLLWAALLGGAALFLVPLRLRAWALVGLLILVPAMIAPYLFPRPFAPASEPALADIARYELGGGARGTASANEYLPRWVADPNPPSTLAQGYLTGEVPDRLDRDSLPPGGEARPIRLAPLEDVYELDLPQAATLRIRRFFYPGWQAWIDDRSVPIEPEGAYGWIAVPAPEGTHQLRLRFDATPARDGAAVLVLSGLALAVVMSWLGRRARSTELPRGNKQSPGKADWKTAVIAAATVVLLSAAVLLVIGPHTRWFRRDSPIEAPAGMRYPLHARFANGVELIGYSVSNSPARQGDTVGVRLYWRALRPQGGNSRPFLHLDSVTGDTTWANQTKLHAGDKPSTTWPTDFYVIDDYRLAIPDDTPPVVAILQAGLLDERGERVPLADGSSLATLAPLRVGERHPLDTASVPGHEQVYQLGPSVRLIGSSPVITGTPPSLDLTLYWQATAPVAAPYTVFVHILDSGGKSLMGSDGPPMSGWYPSTNWLPGQIVVDRRWIPLPQGVDPAGLRVAVGLYTAADGLRAPVLDHEGLRQPDDQVILPLTQR
jgi:hypothetical protein